MGWSTCTTPAPVVEEYYNLMYYVVKKIISKIHILDINITYLLNKTNLQHDCRPPDSRTPVMDLNVIPVWELMNRFGKEVVVMVVDQGVDTTHPELRDRFVGLCFLPSYH